MPPHQVHVHSHLTPSLLPSPQLISFDGYEDQSSLLDLDLDEFEFAPPPSSTPTERIRTHSYGGGSNININLESDSLNPEARAFYPSTPQAILLSSEGEVDNQEELRRLFTIYSRSPSPSPSPTPTPTASTGTGTTIVRQRRASSSTSPQDQRRRRSTSSANSLPEALPRKRRSTKEETLIQYDNYDDLSYPPSPVLDTPDLTSDSTASSYPLPDRPSTAGISQYIILSDPSDLEGLFTYRGTAYPFPQEALTVTQSRTRVGNTSANTGSKEEVEELIHFEEYQAAHSAGAYNTHSEDTDDSALIDLLGLGLDTSHKSEDSILKEVDFGLDHEGEAEEAYSHHTGIDYKFGLDTDESDDIEGLVDLGFQDNIARMNGHLPYDDQPDGDSSSNAIKGATAYLNPLNQSSQAASSSLNSASSSFSPQSSSTPTVHNVSPYNLLLSKPSPRATVPSSLIHPSQPDVFQSEIMQAWISTEPTQASKDFIMDLLSKLTSVINRRFGSKGDQRFLVDVFGSVSWGGETGKSGDLDLVILDRAQLRGYEPSLWRQPADGTANSNPTRAMNGRRSVPPPISELPRCYYTYDLASCLREAGMREVQPIPSASTPIVKFKDPTGKMECDINVNDLGGWYNSSLILHYCLISPYLLRPMIYILKRWLSSQDLNDASGAKGPATMSSYCLTLMIIAYLQARGCLPNLQRDINVPPISLASDPSDPDVIWVSWSKQQGVPAHVAFSLSPPGDWKSSEPDLTVSDAVRGFFAFFSHTSPLFSASQQEKARFDHTKQIISILQGGLASRVTSVGGGRIEDQQQRNQLQQQGFSLSQIDSVMEMMRETRIKKEEKMGKGDRGIQPRNWSERRLVVQDPFLWQKNCAGMMSKAGLDRFFACVDRAHEMLRNKGKSATIVELLFNPNPIVYKPPTLGRGRGFGGSPVSMRGMQGGRGLWSP
ncbi:hypothetical protein I302_106677 [Kwoniella bestiolae CBS 10118]|uniref:Poly(A) RNA polymerase mitochondrial-like central palm domain-containing protein n=1 Tax=Kwoniella bestiolae CBS 10118 TaxID=1296100 RepID=A0A1B9G0R3_9TREE|nr:hypothetical protein I302_06061 [Kwoniella bestiolae CBS 10118]OCF24600.1 hypothetical protein I302_06061 [Kwoniella bestiolae CBS 10118]